MGKVRVSALPPQDARFIATQKLIPLLEIPPVQFMFSSVGNGMLSRIVSWIVIGTILFARNQAIGCAAVSDEPEPPKIFVTAERAVIIWDEAHKIEHFIRQASFLTKDPEIGFLVPTPQAPQLSEVDDRIFDLATSLGQAMTMPPTNYQSPWTLVSPVVTSTFLHLSRLGPENLLSGFGDLRFEHEKAAVMAEQDVAGYHATTLAAEDESLLSGWLETNGYFSTPELKAWLKPYIAAKWTITAFKLIKRDDAPLLVTRAVRLSFHTNRPFYPYSEPSDRQQANAASPQGRALRVTVLSNERMFGILANNKPWMATLEFAGSSTPPPSFNWNSNQWLQYARLNDTGSDTALPTKLTTFIDESNPRPGTADLYFSPDRDQTSFQGATVDFDLPPRNQLVFSHSFGDLAALFMLVTLPAVPLYCGWTVLNLRPEEDANPLRSRRRPQLSYSPQIPNPRELWLRVTDAFVGTLAVILGIFYGCQFILLFLGETASAFLGWSAIGGYWVWWYIGLAMAAFPIMAMAWGVILCGVNLLRVQLAGVPLRRNDLVFTEGARQGFIGASSLLAGSIASLAVLGVLVSML